MSAPEPTPLEAVAKAMLMVTQGDVDPEYAWRVQDDEVREELLAQADVATTVLLAGDWLERVLRAHSDVGTGDPQNWECGGCGDILIGRDHDDEPDDDHVLDALTRHQAAAVRTASGAARG